MFFYFYLILWYDEYHYTFKIKVRPTTKINLVLRQFFFSKACESTFSTPCEWNFLVTMIGHTGNDTVWENMHIFANNRLRDFQLGFLERSHPHLPHTLYCVKTYHAGMSGTMLVFLRTKYFFIGLIVFFYELDSSTMSQ